MNESRFDPERSAAIRSMLIQTVDAEPERARRVRLRVALATVLAAIGLTFGGTAVAVALSGGTLFTVGAPAPVETTSAPVVSTPTPTEVSRPEPTAPAHPLVVTGDRILPHDLVSAPAASPAWSIDLPVIGGVPGCSYDTITDVADGYALVQQTLIVGDTTPAVCDSSVNRMAVTLVDTAVGTAVWSREWSWEHTGVDSTTARLLGTSGRVLVWDPAAGAGPAEVLDLATGETLGPVTVPEGYGVGNLSLVTGDSGDVVYPAQRLDAEGQRTTAWSIRRADPLDLGNPRWSHELEAEEVLGYNAPGNSSSIVNVPFRRAGGPWMDDVLDLDTGSVMASGVPERSYLSFDGFTLRATGYTERFVPSAVAGIDDAGNEMWAREDATGISIAPIDLPGQKPAAVGLNDGSEVALYTSDGRLELVDGITGETKWAVDAPGCVIAPDAFDRSAVALELQPDGVLFDPRRGCAFDHETGASVDPGGRRETDLGSAVVYELRGGEGTGGRSTIDGVVPGSGTATTFDAVTGEELWTLPIASDERWWSAGGYIVGTSNGRIFGIG